MSQCKRLLVAISAVLYLFGCGTDSAPESAATNEPPSAGTAEEETDGQSSKDDSFLGIATLGVPNFGVPNLDISNLDISNLGLPDLGTPRWGRSSPRAPRYQGLWSPAENWLGRDVSSIESNLPTTEWLVGRFQVSWDANDKQLIVRGGHGSLALGVFYSQRGKAFLLAGHGDAEVTQEGGSISISDQAGEERCRDQTIDTADYEGEELVLRGTLSGPNCHLGYELRFTPQTSRRLRFHARLVDQGQTDPDQINRIFLVRNTGSSVPFYGFGLQSERLDHKGQVIPIITDDSGLGPIPMFYDWSIRYQVYDGFCLENREVSVFDLSPFNQVEIRVFHNEMTGQFFTGYAPAVNDRVPGITEAYTEIAGRAPRVPDWVHSGAIVGISGGSAAVREINRRLMEREAPVAAYWVQDWAGGRDRWQWNLDRTLYPDWETLLGELEEQGIAVLGYVTPYLSAVTAESDDSRDLLAEAGELGYLAHRENGAPATIDYGSVSGNLIDLTNPAAREWMEELLFEQLVGHGMRGWMADYGGALPLDVRAASGQSGWSLHNEYPELWAEVSRNVLDRAGREGVEEEGVAIHRTAFSGSPGLASMFSLGDQEASWEESGILKASILGLKSAGTVGLSVTHSEIGGRLPAWLRLGSSPEDTGVAKEVFMRSAEINAFTAIYRTRADADPLESHRPDAEEETMSHFVYFAKIFAALAPYRTQLFREAEELGYPVVRTMLFHYSTEVLFTGDTNKYVFMLGQDLVVGPVVDPEATSRKFYLPVGRWVHLWSGETFGSEAITTDVEVRAPLGEPPVFYRVDSEAGALLQAAVDSLGRWTD